jgi:hypothetical protein
MSAYWIISSPRRRPRIADRSVSVGWVIADISHRRAALGWPMR